MAMLLTSKSHVYMSRARLFIPHCLLCLDTLGHEHNDLHLCVEGCSVVRSVIYSDPRVFDYGDEFNAIVCYDHF